MSSYPSLLELYVLLERLIVLKGWERIRGFFLYYLKLCVYFMNQKIPPNQRIDSDLLTNFMFELAISRKIIINQFIH